MSSGVLFLVSYNSFVIVYFCNLEYEKNALLRRHILMFLVNIKNHDGEGGNDDVDTM